MSPGAASQVSRIGAVRGAAHALSAAKACRATGNARIEVRKLLLDDHFRPDRHPLVEVDYLHVDQPEAAG